MKGPAHGRPLDLVVAERWDRLIGDIRSASVARQVPSYERLQVDPAGSPPQVFIREMFVPAEPAQRRTLDLFCAAFVESGGPDGDDRHGQLVLLGPESIRAQTSASADGLMVTDLRVGSAGPGTHTASIMLMRIDRTTRARDIIVSIEDLGRLLDYRGDVAGSTAVAHAIVRRLEVLATANGAEVPVVGTITRLADAPGTDAHQHYLLVNNESTLSFGDDLTVRDGHLMLAGKDGRPAAWRGGDFMLVRFGQPPRRRGDIRSLAQLRREHALVESGLGRERAIAIDTYSSRAASARQASRAEQIVRYTLAGDSASAVPILHAALAEPGADGPLGEAIAQRVTTLGDYWLTSAVLTETTDDSDASDPLRAAALAVQAYLDGRLDQLLGLSLAPESSELFIPIVTPLVLEVSDALVPFVDSRQDSGLFLYELVPGARDRISTGLGVSVPGLRARGAPNLPPGGFTLQLDEITVGTGHAQLFGAYALSPLPDDAPGDAAADITDTHPVTGQSGLWSVKAVEDGERGDGAEYLTLAQYLIYRIDMIYRTNLARFLGPQEVANLVEQWTPAERDLVLAVLPDQGAVVRLTWVLQALVEERIPITEWRTIMGAVRDAGGITTPIRTLARAARARLRGQLPGPRSGLRVQRVPASLQRVLAGQRADPSGRLAGAMPYELQQWLRQTVIAHGPVLSLVTDDEGTRETLATFARSQYELLTTFTEEELTAR